MTSVAVIHYPGATEKSRSVVASLVADQLSLGHSVTVIDISAFTTISQDLPPQWVATILGHRVDHEAFRAEILRLGGDYVLLRLRCARSHSLTNKWKQSQLPSNQNF